MAHECAPEHGSMSLSSAPKTIAAPEKHQGNHEKSNEKRGESGAHVSSDGVARNPFGALAASGARLNSLGASQSQ